MSIKTKIKNDLWKWNYILPFVKKHQFDEKGKIDLAKHILTAYSMIHCVKSKEHTVGYDIKELLKRIEVEVDINSRFVYFIDISKTIAVPGNILSNFTLNYDRIIHGSFKDIADLASGNDSYGREANAVAEGIEALRNHIIDAISNSSMSEQCKSRKKVIFERLLNTPACHFEEALQRILFFNQIMWQTRHRLNGLGRLDKILGDLYLNDLQEGIISIEDANEIVFDFLEQISMYSTYKSDALKGDIGQIIILGGKEEDGTYFSNDLTEIFLKQQAKLGKPDPKTLLRVGKGMPDTLLDLSAEALLKKTGSPLFSNDDVVISALLDFGMPQNDAYSYCTSACWEPYIVGKSLDQNNIAVFDFFPALDKVLGEKSDSFDELLYKYKKENIQNFEIFLDNINQIRWARDPLVSMFIDECNVKRKDVSEGAATYNNYGITTVAIGNVVDSLINIKQLVFDEKRLELGELNRIRKSDYIGNEEIYSYIKSLRKHFGHDDKQTIGIVNEITRDLGETAKHFKNKLGGTVKIGLSSPGYNILSKKTSADVAGRKKGMPYNTHISCTDAPYTEVVGFACKLENKGSRFNGNVIDFFIPPGLIEENKDKFVKFIKASIVSGFFQMQMNIMDSATLVDAKAYPERYKGLIVRVWGFSAYFNDLPESYKDLLIERAKAAENN